MSLLRLLCGLAFVFTQLPNVIAEKPFEFAATPGKLPKSITPEEYAVRIAPNVEQRTFIGSETVKLSVKQPARAIMLNAADLQISGAALDGHPLPANALKLDAQNQTALVSLDSELPVGVHTLALEFSGKINQQGQGLYAATYQEQGTGARKVMLGTQFEATDARRLFPCWDEPSFRARFQFTAVIPENWTAVSNMPAEAERKVEGGKEVRFGTTPPMSSYLNVFCAGELDLIEMQSGPTRIRVVATKGKAEMGRYALEASAQVLQYYNDYFGVAYPLPKLDQIAVPGGFGGAMENWGGITYYESALLFDPNNSSTATKQQVYEVIAHEMAHQWFGDLVTMAWWDNLWLNEGFASWMGTKCSARFNPEWEVWLKNAIPRDPSRRVGIPKETAMESDARSTTHPIQQTIATEAEANSAFDDITYRKGQSFIRMLESFLGEDVFRDGIRRYMTKHQFSNATTEDLWISLSQASGKPVADIAAGWTQQVGFPIVKVTRKNDGKVTLVQERFVVNAPKQAQLLWKIPLTYVVADSGKVNSLLMIGPTAELTNIPGDQALKLNVEGAGNYRVEYDDVSWKLLLTELPRMSVPDRVNLLSDAWALVQANRAPFSLYGDLVARLGFSDELAEREQIINVFDFIDRLLIGTPQREQFQHDARRILRPSFDRLGWEPKAGEPARGASLRSTLIRSLGDLHDDDIIEGCRARFAKFVENPESLAPDLRSPVCAVVGHYADEATWARLHELGLKTTSIEEKQGYYDALAGPTDSALAERTLQISLTDEVPTSRAVFLVSKVARESDHPEVAWQFAKSHMKELLGKTDALAVNSYAPSMFTFFSDASRVGELREFARDNLPASATKEIAKAIDEVTFRAGLKKRLVQQLAPHAFEAH